MPSKSDPSPSVCLLLIEPWRGLVGSYFLRMYSSQRQHLHNMEIITQVVYLGEYLPTLCNALGPIPSIT